MSNKPLTIVANITAKADKVDSVKAELLKLIEPTRAEEGCISYVLHQDNDNPAHFVFLETWQSDEALQQHMETAHIQAYLAATQDTVTEFVVDKLTEVSP